MKQLALNAPLSRSAAGKSDARALKLKPPLTSLLKCFQSFWISCARCQQKRCAQVSGARAAMGSAMQRIACSIALQVHSSVALGGPQMMNALCSNGAAERLACVRRSRHYTCVALGTKRARATTTRC